MWKLFSSRMSVILGLFLSALSITTCNPVFAENNGAALKPPMGWSSWSFMRFNPTESSILAQATAMHNSGLQSHGYSYINIDDGYYYNATTTVDSNGRWLVDAGKFPHGMAYVANNIHSLGLKFGIYVTPGIPVAAYNQNTPILGTPYHARDIVTNTSSRMPQCNCMYYIDYSKPGAQAYINSFANLFASWGVDYVKLDGVGGSLQDVASVKAWSQALQQTGRTIHFELSSILSVSNGSTWQQYSNGWRIENDVECYCNSTSFPLTDYGNINFRLSDEPFWTQFAGRGNWNDLDSLDLGNGNNDGLNIDERRNAITLWCMACSPLILGSDLTNLDGTDMGMMTNDQLIAINQAGSPGAPLVYNSNTQVWRAAESDGSYAVAFFNKNGGSSNVSVNWSQLGFAGPADVRDLFSQQDLGIQGSGFNATVNGHGANCYKVTPTSQAFRFLASAPGNNLTGNAHTAESPELSNGLSVRSVGMGNTLTFNNVSAPSGGTYNLTFFYENGDAGNRTAYVSVNGGAANAVTFNGNSNWQSLQSQTIQVGLNGGNNSIKISNPNGWAPDFDSLVIQSTSSSGLANGTYTLTPQNMAGSRLDATGFGTTNGTTVDVYGANPGANQKWIFTNVGGGWYKVQPSYATGLCLDVVGGGTTNGTHVDLWAYNGGPNQLWKVTPVAGNIYKLSPQSSPGQLLDVPGSTNGTLIDIWGDNNGSNQQWAIGTN